MNKPHKSAIILATLLGVAGLSACRSTAAAPTAAQLGGTPLDRHEIGVMPKTEFLEIRLNPQDTQLRQNDRNRIENFVRAYTDSGHGPLVMSMPAEGANSQLAVQAVVEAREIAWSLGVEYEEISGNAYDAQSDRLAPLILAYQSYEAMAPQCDSLARYDMANVSSNNELPTFGCAVRKNMAAMIADPADLLGTHPLDQGDVVRRAVILEKFRNGEITGASKSSDESGTVSTAVQN